MHKIIFLVFASIILFLIETIQKITKEKKIKSEEKEQKLFQKGGK